MFVTVSGNALFRIAWRSPWGAISIVIASLGMCLSESSNSTQLNRLFVWYSDDEYFPRSEFHSVSGNELLIHLEDLNFGVLITCKHNLIYLCSNTSFVITFFFTHFVQISEQNWTGWLNISTVICYICGVHGFCERSFGLQFWYKWINALRGTRYGATCSTISTSDVNVVRENVFNLMISKSYRNNFNIENKLTYISAACNDNRTTSFPLIY